MTDWDKERRKEYSRQKYAEKKELREKIKRFKEMYPEEYAQKVQAIREEERAKIQAVTDFHNLVGLDFFKAVSVHVCPDLTCSCNIGETPAMTSPIIREAQKCNTCGQTYSALLYNVGWTTTNQHTCSQYGIFIMTASDYKKSSDIENLNNQWSGKILLAGEGEAANVYETRQYFYHNTLKWFKPQKALYGVCSKCYKPILDGMLPFSDNSRTGHGMSDLLCSRCCNNPQDYPYGFEVREDGVGFFKNADFDWDSHILGQKSKVEEEYARYRNILNNINNMEGGS